MRNLDDAKADLDRNERRNLWDERRDPTDKDFQMHANRIASSVAGVCEAMIQEGRDAKEVIGFLFSKASGEEAISTNQAIKIFSAALKYGPDRSYMQEMVAGLSRYEGQIDYFRLNSMGSSAHERLQTALWLCSKLLERTDEASPAIISDEIRENISRPVHLILNSNMSGNAWFSQLQEMYPEFYK
jgi:hypothetical protein